MRNPCRVAIWGPGTVGGALLRRVIRKPEFELAGVLAWSESKVGKDAGDIVGLGPTGITVSGDPEEIYEVYNSGPLSADLLSVAGFGADPEDSAGREALAAWADNYLRQVVAHGGAALGVTFDEIKQTTEVRIAPHDITLPDMVVKQGTVAAVTNSWIGLVDGKPFYTLTTYWYVGQEIRPFEVPSDDHWIITVEGNPSARMTLDLKASVAKDIYMTEEENTPAGMIATGLPLLQAVPVVCASPPGIVRPSVFAHWRKDLRGFDSPTVT